MNDEKIDTGLDAYIIQVYLSNGQMEEHIYPISDITEALEVMNTITDAFSRKTWNIMNLFIKSIPQILSLRYPDIIYNPDHILFIKHRIK